MQKQTLESSDSVTDNNRRQDYERRKSDWAAKYTSVSAPRNSFGHRKTPIVGDFGPTTTRHFYHILLPCAVLELKELRDTLLANESHSTNDFDFEKIGREKASPDKEDSSETYLQNELKELAPLAYQARLAAKKYARERSRIHIRLASLLYDGYRSWRRYGKWKSSGMTYDQIWAKYKEQVLREAEAAVESGDDLGEEELTARIYSRILERSVKTNWQIDKLLLKHPDRDNKEEKNTTQVLTFKVSRKSLSFIRRKRQIEADLQTIKTKLDSDLNDLFKLEPID